MKHTKQFKALTILAAIIFTVAVNAGEKYSFMMISDTHFGSTDSFGADPPPRLRRNGERMAGALPHYCAMYADMVRKSDASNRFLIHLGDLIEGHGYSREAQIGQFRSAEKLLKRYFRCPVYMVRGNHESSGKFGKDVCRDVILPAIAANAGKPPRTVHYTIRCGGDLFIFVNAYAPGYLKFVRETLKNLKTRPRYVFCAIHADQLPQAKKEVLELCELLAQYNGIILSGHTHRTQVFRWSRDGKTVTQFSVGSCLTPVPGRMRYGDWSDDKAAFLGYFRKKRVRTQEENRIFDTKIVPFLTDYREPNAGKYKTGQGYARVFVADTGISVLLQSGDIAQPPLEWTLVGSGCEREK